MQYPRRVNGWLGGVPSPWPVVILLAVGMVLAAVPATAQTIGMVADDLTNRVIVFNADTGAVLGVVVVPNGPAIGDTLITADQTLGFVTNFAFRVFVIDLATSPPSLAAPVGGIPISNTGEDLSISPDQQFLVVSDASGIQPLSVIDIASRTQISTFFTGTDSNSVDICSDGSVLVTSFRLNRLRRLTIDGAGNLANTGDIMVMPSPMNAYCAPGATSGFTIGYFSRLIRSFTIPGLAAVDSRSISPSEGFTGLINPAGDRAVGRGTTPDRLLVFGFNSATGALSTSPIATLSVSNSTPFFGMEQIAIHPDGSKLYVPEFNALNVYDATTLGLLFSITDPAIVRPTGVALPPAPGVIPFEFFDVRVEVEIEDGEFEVKGMFTLDGDTDGIDPLTEDVSLQVGPYSTTVPAGFFELTKSGKFGEFEYEGIIDGLDLKIRIRPLGGDTFRLDAEGEGTNVAGTVNPVEVVLTIGDDTGTISVVAELED